MANILKCKMCGGDIEVGQDMTVGKCLFCGSTMTLPRIDSDKKARLFNRANEYRLNNEFDKAYDAYKTITEEDEQEAEAYWGMILSEYGVEYVEDPASHNRVATCHRTRVQNIVDSTNFQLAIKYADAERRFMYQDEAEALEQLQHSILAISSKEEAYDVFICYKESDDEGNRTEDSVLAQEIYNELTKVGISVFFSRISLETHLGENYEPYIYGALTSAKVMLMVSTSANNCNAVWVKNEWKRFLAFMQEDSSKTIIPVYKTMSPYEFPSELSGYQAQNMEKIGAVQDLVYGVQKLLGQTNNTSNSAAVNELLAEKRQRDAQEKKKTKTKKIVIKFLLIAIVCFVLIVCGFLFVPKINKLYWSNQIATKTFSAENGIPSCDEYMKLDLTVTEDNFDDYFQLITVDNDRKNGVVIKNNLYDKGWIYLGSSGMEFEEKTYRTKNNSDYKDEVGYFTLLLKPVEKSSEKTLLPYWNNPTITKGNVMHYVRCQVSFSKSLEKFHVYYISKNAVQDYRFDGNRRIVTLKDGTVIEDDGAPCAEKYPY